MCDRLETAFCRLWEAAGLGSAAAAAARPHVLSPAAPTHGRNEARGKPHQRQTHGKSGAKPSPRSTAAKLSTAQEPRPAGKPGGGRKNSHGGTGSAGGAPAKRQRAEAGAPAPISPPAPAVPAALPDLPEDFSLAPAQLADAEVAEEALELERLLGTGGTSPTAAAAAAAATGGSSSPVLWEAALPGGLGPDAVAEAVAVPEALAGLGPGAAPSLQANGEAAVSERDRFGADWQAVGTSALASPMASRQAASGVLLHPDREPLAAHGSLPPPLPRHHSLEPPQQRADAPLHAPPVGTAGAAREGMQREESVLAAWQRVQAQRQAALQAMAAAEAAAHEVVKARQVSLSPCTSCLGHDTWQGCCCAVPHPSEEGHSDACAGKDARGGGGYVQSCACAALVVGPLLSCGPFSTLGPPVARNRLQELAAVRAAEAAASAGAPVSSQSQAAWEQQQLRRQEESPATASGLTGEQPGRLPSTGYSRSAVMNGLRAAAAAGCSSSELASMATAARQVGQVAGCQLAAPAHARTVLHRQLCNVLRGTRHHCPAMLTAPPCCDCPSVLAGTLCCPPPAGLPALWQLWLRPCQQRRRRRGRQQRQHSSAARQRHWQPGAGFWPIPCRPTSRQWKHPGRVPSERCHGGRRKGRACCRCTPASSRGLTHRPCC